LLVELTTNKEINMEHSLDEDIHYINRMREEITEAENTPNDIEVLRRHSALDIVLIPEGMKPVSGQENALNLMKQMWSVFDVETNYQSEVVNITENIAIDRGWAKEILKNKSNGEIIENLVNYLWISRRDTNGVWKQTHVIWNKRSE
jgi:ketosteroid isomerase-like protein